MRRLAPLALVAALLGVPERDVAARHPEPAPAPARPRPEPTAAEQAGFWTKVAHPHRERYDELTTQGRALYEQEKPGLAIDLLSEAARLDPARPDAWWFLGMSYQRLDRFAECADALDHVLALAPGGWVPEGLRPSVPQPAHALALCDAAAGRLEASVALLEQALTAENLGPDASAMLTYNLGDSYQALGRLEDAIRAYRRAIELRGNVPLYRFALAVALDRDEEGARAREEMLAALTGDRSLSSIALPSTIFVPPEDEDYYRGFALEVLAASDLPRNACQPWMCRSLARVYFRRYVTRAPQSPWHARVDAHLLDLGDAAPHEDEMAVAIAGKPAEAAAGAPYVKTIAALVPKLRTCVAEKPLLLLRADVYLPGKSGTPPPAGVKPMPGPAQPSERSFTVQNGGPAPADEQARLCVTNVLGGAKWPVPVVGPVRIQFGVGGP